MSYCSSGTKPTVLVNFYHNNSKVVLCNKFKEKFVILQAIGIILIKSKETRVIAYTHRYFSGPLIPNSATVLQTELHRD